MGLRLRSKRSQQPTLATKTLPSPCFSGSITVAALWRVPPSKTPSIICKSSQCADELYPSVFH